MPLVHRTRPAAPRRGGQAEPADSPILVHRRKFSVFSPDSRRSVVNMAFESSL